MPQDGSQNYQYPPGTRGIPDETIESAAYNNFLDDLVDHDLNIPRPIHRGGTAATTADQALINLGAEKATQLVTNYDTHVWLPGSFRSTSSATSGPVGGHAFAGIVYINEPLLDPPTNANVIVSARDMDDTVVPSRVHVREKKANVWGAWTVIDATTLPFPPGGGLSATTIMAAIQELDAEKASIVYVDDEITDLLTHVDAADTALQTDIDTRLLRSGDTMIGELVLHDHPVIPLQAATKQYVDELLAAQEEVRYNRLTNPAMQISQENGNAPGSASGYYAADEWTLLFVSTATFLIYRDAVPTPNGSPDRLNFSVSTPDATLASNDYCRVRQGIEYIHVSDFLWGTPSAKNVIVRFGWNSPAGTFSVGIASGIFGRSFVKNFTVSAGQANTDLEFVLSIPGDTGGVPGDWGPNPDNLGMHLSFCIASGSANMASSTAEVWHAGGLGGFANANNTNGLAATGLFQLFDVGLYTDPPSRGIPPTWTLPDPAKELLACQRYYYKFAGRAYSVAAGAAGTLQIIETHPVQMVRKKTPMVTLSGVILSGVSTSLVFSGLSTDFFTMALAVSGAGTANATYNAVVSARM